jgi:hypothetical protein
MIEIPVQGSDRPALIDDEDYELVSQFKWFATLCATKQYHYVMANLPKARAIELGVAVRNPTASQSAGGTKRRLTPLTRISLHRLVMHAQPGEIVDHIYHDTFDCRKSELRRTDFMGNGHNRRKVSRPTSSQYIGVWHTDSGRWRAQIGNKHLGTFDTEIEAAHAYDRRCMDRGEFAVLNFALETATA